MEKEANSSFAFVGCLTHKEALKSTLQICRSFSLSLYNKMFEEHTHNFFFFLMKKKKKRREKEEKINY